VVAFFSALTMERVDGVTWLGIRVSLPGNQKEIVNLMDDDNDDNDTNVMNGL
jgi:hypothetical protein